MTPSAPALRILVVDDSHDVADSTVEILQAIGHDARAVYRSPDALLVAAAFAPQLVLLDLDMPGDDGFEVLRRLRHAQHHLEPAFIAAVTGHGEPGYLRRTAEAGFDEHLTKPVTTARLQRLIDRTLEARGPTPAS